MDLNVFYLSPPPQIFHPVFCLLFLIELTGTTNYPVGFTEIEGAVVEGVFRVFTQFQEAIFQCEKKTNFMASQRPAFTSHSSTSTEESSKCTSSTESESSHSAEKCLLQL